MKKTQKIGWQKYEDVLEGQINCPLAEQFYASVMRSMEGYPEDILDQHEQEYMQEPPLESDGHFTTITLDKDFSKEILLAANYDCWMGYTNFNITPIIKDLLDEIDGVEILKICTRYRFFIGIGRMFDFSDVRKRIEDKLNINE